MKTTQQLIELQRSEPLKDQLKELENYCAEIGFNETADTIALVPELLAEVIRLREEAQSKRTVLVYRDFKVERSESGSFFVDGINCFGALTEHFACRAIDRYIDGDKDPQCRAALADAK